MKIEAMTELQAVLDMKEWKLGLAAWIFSGHSPLQKKTSGTIVRITDNQVFQFGSVEYREAETAKNKIKEMLNQRVIDSRCLASIDEKERYDRNWLISIAIDSGFDVWWKDWAVKAWLVPAYIAPNALDPQERKSRGSFSWKIGEEVFDQPNFGEGPFGEGGFGESKPAEGKDILKDEDIQIIALFKAGKINPTEYIENDTKKQFKAYQLFYDVIHAMAEMQAEKQSGIFGIDEVHSYPLPTAAIARDRIISQSEWFLLHSTVVSKSKTGSKLEWYYKGHDGQPESNKPYVLDMNALNKRIRDWFQKTEKGLEYDQHFNRNKDKYFK